MHALRAIVRGHWQAAILAVALALCMRAILPAGYMISSATGADSSQILTLALCNADGSGAMTTQVSVPVDGHGVDSKGTQGGDKQQGKANPDCAYSSLSMAAMGGASAPLLALALAFLLALGVAPVRQLPFGQIAYLRPPLRGPPAMA